MEQSANLSKDFAKELIVARTTVAQEQFDSNVEWRLFCDGSESAFIKLYNHYFDLLYNLGRQYSGDAELLKDALQDVFVNIRKKRSKLHKVKFVKAYLIKCYRNKIITEQKKQKRKSRYKSNSGAFDFYFAPSHESVLINTQFRQGQIQQIKKSLNKLTRRQREALYYFYYNGLSYAQIKEVMGFSSVRAARNLIYRSLSQLKKNFQDLNTNS
ncbi:RNA polymerase sigma factor [Muricauda sp. 2012CJ35-5]|uniref:RNA polymerase sigma factor n=1 Tax=Flagellimonas spongiicola TaxID=2942208 RepID=A0ABT0PQV3_9FLAO|nr:RNA polymerase sigma factor [Allomuricauda spongiicola]MCL6273758.1 RNA polymerase sigma factor [Allomuricauda spongiicola]